MIADLIGAAATETALRTLAELVDDGALLASDDRLSARQKEVAQDVYDAWVRGF